MKNKKGFTLVELIVVLAILAILIAIAVPVAFGSLERAKDKAVTASISNINGAVNVAHSLTFTSPKLQSLFDTEQLAILYYKDNKFMKSGTKDAIYEDFYLDALNKSSIQMEKDAFVVIIVREHPAINVYDVFITYSKKGYSGSGVAPQPNYPYYQYTSPDNVYRKHTAPGVSEIID